jgi:L-ectoine synthase
MIVRTLADTINGANHVFADTWNSRRLLLADDGMGFSLHDTIIEAGTETRMWYRHHLEAVYCIEGEGTVEDTDTGTIHEIGPGTVYALDQHDKHVLRARTRMRMVCVFNPPCTGQETHDENGTYPLLTSADGNGRETTQEGGRAAV